MYENMVGGMRKFTIACNSKKMKTANLGVYLASRVGKPVRGMEVSGYNT
jgi:hypothetical protein